MNKKTCYQKKSCRCYVALSFESFPSFYSYLLIYHENKIRMPLSQVDKKEEKKSIGLDRRTKYIL